MSLEKQLQFKNSPLEAGPPPPGDRFVALLELFYGNWIWRAIHALLDHPRFVSSPEWISETLNISLEETVDALEGLEELHLISRNHDGRMTARSPQFIMPEEMTLKEKLVKQHKQISQQIISRSEVSQVEGSLTYFMNIEPRHLYAALEKVFGTIKQLEETPSPSEKLNLYSISLTCSNLAPKLQGDK